MGVKAKIEQTNPTRPPTMGEGDVDAAVLWDWFNRSEQFFHHKSTAVELRVISITWGMSGVHAVRWLLANLPLLEEMSWNNYKDHMRTLFLPTDWEHTTRMDVLRIQQGTRPFIDFLLDLMGQNNLLAGTDSFFNDEFLRNTLEANMDCDLAKECNHENVNSAGSLRDWLNEVKRINKHRRQRMEEIEKTLARINTRSSANRFPQATHIPFAARNVTAPAGSTTGAFVPIPKLLPEERALLADNGGCFKCHRFWAGHLGVRCSALPIDGSKYKSLMQKNVPSRPANNSSRSGSTSVATVLNTDNVESSSASISEVGSENVPPVNNIHPLL